MNSMDEKVKACFKEIHKDYRELKRGGGVDPFTLKEKIKSFISDLKSKGDEYEGLRKEAEDILMDVTFIIQESCCAPFKAESIK